MKAKQNNHVQLKKTTVALLDELTNLVGRKSWQRVSKPCTGKWRGTTDYGIKFDDGLYYYFSNGMANFETALSEALSYIRTVRTNREEYLRILRNQAVRDNAVAASEGLIPVQVVDVGIETQSETNFLWAYVLLEVGGRSFKFIETGLSYSMKNNTMQKWTDWCSRPIFTAGAVQQPDHIFGNVRFSSTDRLYKV